MQLLNHTPFPALAFPGIDTSDREYRVVVIRTTYQLTPTAVQGEFVPVLMEEAPPPLELEDRYMSAAGESSLVCESDLAPFKPRCDVLLTGTARAPDGRPHHQWPVRLRLSKGGDDHETPRTGSRFLLDKSLIVHGPRHFKKSLLGIWDVHAAEPALGVPLQYELAYGGSSIVPAPARSSPTHSKNEPEFLLNEVCFSNPLGRGWRHVDFERHAKSAGMSVSGMTPAPQIEAVDDPIQGLDLVSQPPGPLRVDQMAQIATSYRHSPAGFGPVGRAWTPRVQRAGSYDEEWLQNRWPNLPRDFDMGYWNCAPEDQQIPYPPSNLTIELLNLTDPAQTRGGLIAFRLPGHRAAVLFRLRSGLLLGATPVIDTLHIDAESLRVALVWRATVTAEMNVAVAEVRFERDPSRALFRMSPHTLDVGRKHLEARDG